MGIGPREIVVILLVVLLLFGTRRLGDIGKGLGQGIRNFKKGLNENEGDEASEGAPDGQAEKDEEDDSDEEKQLAEKPLTDRQSARKKQGKV